jgi:ribosomal protein S27E
MRSFSQPNERGELLPPTFLSDSYFEDTTCLRSSHVLSPDYFLKSEDSNFSPFRFGSVFDAFLSSELTDFLRRLSKDPSTDFFMFESESGQVYNFSFQEWEELFEAKKALDEFKIQYQIVSFDFQKVVKKEIDLFGDTVLCKCKIDLLATLENGKQIAFDLKTKTPPKECIKSLPSFITPTNHAQQWFYSEISGYETAFLLWNRNLKTLEFRHTKLEKGKAYFYGKYQIYKTKQEQDAQTSFLIQCDKCNEKQIYFEGSICDLPSENKICKNCGHLIEFYSL